jgi:hypothetical protein
MLIYIYLSLPSRGVSAIEDRLDASKRNTANPQDGRRQAHLYKLTSRSVLLSLFVETSTNPTNSQISLSSSSNTVGNTLVHSKSRRYIASI